MIFSNKGFTQLDGTPMDNILEITQVLSAFRKRALDNGETVDFADTAIVLAGRLSTLSEQQINQFLGLLPRDTVSLDELMDIFEKYTDGK